MTQYNETLKANIKAYMEKEKLSQAKLAPMIGISPTALSQWINSKYERGNIEEVESKIDEFLRIEREKELAEIEKRNNQYRTLQGYIPTGIYPN